jgi:hypothetical protein
MRTRKRPGVALAVALGAVGAAVAKELLQPASERTWTGELAGIVPYDLRPPTRERLRAKVWAPEDPRILTPHGWGVGWAVNVGRLVALARGAESSWRS